MDSIYLDNNSTTQILPEVAETMNEAHRAGYANPASQHLPGQRARRVLEEAREEIATILGAPLGPASGDWLVFTSGGTEANNLALRGMCGEAGSNVVVSAIEHASVLGVCAELERQGCEVRILPVTPRGVFELDALPELVDDRTRLVSVMLANNETGVLQPLARVSALCNSLGVAMHTDAVQAIGKIAVHFQKLGAAMLSLSAHKFHGPPGIGALLLRQGVVPRPILWGGFQQRALRPGTESVPLVLGMLKALQLWQQEADQRTRRLYRLRDRLESSLRSELPSLVINGESIERLPHTTSMAVPGVDRQALLMALDLAGVAASSGSACSSGSSEPSHVLQAMGLPRDVVEGSIRLSLSALTTTAEVDAASRRIVHACNALRRT